MKESTKANKWIKNSEWPFFYGMILRIYDVFDINDDHWDFAIFLSIEPTESNGNFQNINAQNRKFYE